MSKSHVVNAFMVAPTTLLYTVPMNEKNFARVRELSLQYMQSWLELLDETDGPARRSRRSNPPRAAPYTAAHTPCPALRTQMLDGIGTKEVQAELLKLDVRTRQFCGRDPDTKNVANIFGLETTDKLVRTLWGDPDDPIWQGR